MKVAIYGSLYEGDPVSVEPNDHPIAQTLFPPLFVVADAFGISSEQLFKYITRVDYIKVYTAAGNLLVLTRMELYENNHSDMVH